NAIESDRRAGYDDHMKKTTAPKTPTLGTKRADRDGDPVTRRIREICADIEAQRDGSLNLADLAKRAQLSPFHFQRRFKAVVGVSPKQYANAVRLRNLRMHLRSAKDVTTAVYDAGFGSSSRVYEQADTRLGMTPRQYRSGG